MNHQLPIAGSSQARTKVERPSHGTPSPGCRRGERPQAGDPPLKREKAPEGLFGDAGALGAAQRSRRMPFENGRGRRGPLTCPEGLGRLVAPG